MLINISLSSGHYVNGFVVDVGRILQILFYRRSILIYPKVALSSEPRLSGACLVLLVVRCQFVGSSVGELIVCLLRILFLFGKKNEKDGRGYKKERKRKEREN